MKIMVIAAFIAFFSNQTTCMKRLSFTSQDMITVAAADKNIKIEEWKVFQSKVLSKHYSGNNVGNKDTYLLQFPGIPCATTLQLCSDALDYSPGVSFKNYVTKLPPNKRAMLISLAGAYDKDGNETQLCMPGLTAQLVDACLPSDISQHIKSYVNKDQVVCGMIYNAIEHEANFLPHSSYGDGNLIQIFSTINDDYVRNVYMSDNSRHMTRRMIDDVNWTEYCSCQLSEQKECFITASVPSDKQYSKKLYNTFLLWYKRANNSSKKNLFDHHEGEITALCINGQRRLVVSSVVKKDNNSIRLWKCSGELLYQFPCMPNGRVIQLIFINDGDGLLVNFLGKDTSLIKIWDIARLHTIQELTTAYRPGNDFFCYAIIDPDLMYRGDLFAAIITYYDHVVSVNCWNFYDEQGVIVDNSFNSNDIKTALHQWRLDRYIKEPPFAWIKEEHSCFLMYLLYRLYEDNNHNTLAVLYQEEPAYKLLQALPAKEECNVRGLLQKCFEMYILTNKKSESENCVIL